MEIFVTIKKKVYFFALLRVLIDFVSYLFICCYFAAHGIT